MIVKYSPLFLKNLKKIDVRIRNSFREKIVIFSRNPFELELNNHELKREYQGRRSIDITSDWRAIYEERFLGEEVVAYFIALGAHGKLYKKSTD